MRADFFRDSSVPTLVGKLLVVGWGCAVDWLLVFGVARARPEAFGRRLFVCWSTRDMCQAMLSRSQFAVCCCRLEGRESLACVRPVCVVSRMRSTASPDCCEEIRKWARVELRPIVVC